MSKENPNYFAIIPANVRYDKRLNGNDKLLYGEITALANKEGYCWAGNKYFADLYGVHKDTIGTWLAKLEKCGYIVRDTIRDKNKVLKRKIRINQIVPEQQEDKEQPIGKNTDTPIGENTYTPTGENTYTPIGENTDRGIGENALYNNTSKSNNTSNNNISVQKQVFEYWILKSDKEKALVKHQKYTDTFDKAINKAIKIFGKDLDKLKLLIDRFIICFDKSQDTAYPIRSRPFYEFFGQKVKDGVILICQEYDDDGSKWLRYFNSPKKKKTVFD